jgi:hypothetical protein
MDDSLRLIQYLYGEDVDDPDFPRRVAEDDDLQREFEHLQETKEALDQRSPPSPDPAVVDQIVDRAAEAAQPDRAVDPAPDRAARAREHDWARRWQNAGAALALVLAVGMGWWYMPGETSPSGPVADEAPAQQSTAATAAAESAGDADALPEWDDRDEVVELHRRLELLQTQSRSDAWGGNPQPASRTQP